MHYLLPLALTLEKKAYRFERILLAVPKNWTIVLIFCLGKFILLCLSSNAFYSSRIFSLIKPVTKNDDRSQPSNYRTTSLISCLSKVFETILNC